MQFKEYAGIKWPAQADFFAPDDQVFEIVKMNDKWYICQTTVPLRDGGGYLAIFDHFPTWEEVMLKCWKHQGSTETFRLYQNTDSELFWQDDAGAWLFWDTDDPPANPWEIWLLNTNETNSYPEKLTAAALTAKKAE